MLKAFVRNPKVIIPLCANSSINIAYQDYIDVEELPKKVGESLKAIKELL